MCSDVLTPHPGPSLTRRPPRLRAGGEYFSDEQMRFRAPLLYEQYIGQYLTQEELSARAPAHRPPEPGAPGTACPLSDLLLQSCQERELQQRLLRQQEEEEACLEEEEEEEDSDEEGEGQYWGGPRLGPPDLQGQTPSPACPECPGSPSLSSIAPPPPCSSKAPRSHHSPPGHYSCCSLCQECLPFPTLQVAGPDPALQSPECYIVLLCSVCAPGGQDRGCLGHRCVPGATSTEEAALCGCVFSTHPRAPVPSLH